MVNTFDRSSGASVPDTACFQMSDDEFATVLRGWKPPPPLGEEIVTRSGTNPFTNKVQVFVRRHRVEKPAPPDLGAVRSPRPWDLPWIDMGELYGFHLDFLAAILLGWSRQYATGVVSEAFVNGPEDRNDWFVLFPDRVVRAVADVQDEWIPGYAARWRTSDPANPIDAADALLQKLVPFARSAVASNRRVYLWGSR